MVVVAQLDLWFCGAGGRGFGQIFTQRSKSLGPFFFYQEEFTSFPLALAVSYPRFEKSLLLRTAQNFDKTLSASNLHLLDNFNDAHDITRTDRQYHRLLQISLLFLKCGAGVLLIASTSFQ
jgi:hypothetical protein